MPTTIFFFFLNNFMNLMNLFSGCCGHSAVGINDIED